MSEAQNRTDSATPKPEGAEHLSNSEKVALEMQDHAEHSQGREREKSTEKAESLANREQ